MKKKIKYKQLDITDCGAACLASVASYYGFHIPITQIRQYAGTGKSGTNLLGMIQAANKMGLLAKALRIKEDALDKLPLPAIAHLNIKGKWLHYVVLYKAARGRVKIMDPAEGKILTKDMAEFRKDWTGIALILAPGNHFEPGDKTSSAFSKFIKLIKPHRAILIQSLTGAIVYSLLGISTSIYVEKLVDVVIPSGNKNLLNLLSISLLLILLLRTVTGYLKSLMLLKTGQKIDAMLVLGYFRHLFKLPSVFFQSMRTGEIISRVNDAVKIRYFINNTALNLSVNILIVLLTLAVMMGYSMKITIMILASLPLYFLAWHIYNKVNTKGLRRTMEHSAELESVMVESIKGMGTIKGFGLERESIGKIDNNFVRLLNSSFRVNRNAILTGNFTEILSGIILLAIFWTGTNAIFNHELSNGELLSFYTLFTYLSGPLNALLLSNRTLQDALIAADRLFQIMELENEKNPSGPLEINLRQPVNILKAEGLSFGYPGKGNILGQINLVVKSPGIYAIVGESGSGKSTLLSIISGMEREYGGKLSLNGTDYRYLPREELKMMIAAVTQDIFLFTGTILSNIALGDYSPDIARVSGIIKKTGMQQFIDSREGGLYNMIVENGSNLSGGEKQKIAIARALYRNPSILLLDEAGSSLDFRSAEYLKNLSLKFRAGGGIVVQVAHRLSTVKHADRIFVLKDGAFTESGSHDELLKQEGEYHYLWKSQIFNVAGEY